ncbi:hypothetical protein V6Z11_A10G120600 [Gossypium hirsutum]
MKLPFSHMYLCLYVYMYSCMYVCNDGWIYACMSWDLCLQSICRMCILLEDISAEVLMIKEMCFSIPSNKYAEFNVPPFVFRKVSFRIRINITLIPLSVKSVCFQRS